MRCAVIGAGAWGTALADLLARNSHAVRLWAYEADVVTSIRERRENVRFLPGVTLHHSLAATGDLACAVEDATLITYVTPSHAFRRVARQSASVVPLDATLVVASKGIEQRSLATMSAVIADEVPGRDTVVLSGPSFAAEVAAREPTAIVAASVREEAAEAVQRTFSSDTFRVYTHDDALGVEIAGAIKNVIAIATGIAEGLGLGHNSRAALITRGLAEITRLGVALGAQPQTFAGLAGTGDLVLTCTGSLSRNRSLGMAIGAGASLDEELARRETVAEGVPTTQSAYALASREGVDMPIAAAVHRTLFEGQPARQAISDLMTRELRPEQDR
jgi:glycerol-3-phosphate dehydrogenase (NAD(P)+)